VRGRAHGKDRQRIAIDIQVVLQLPRYTICSFLRRRVVAIGQSITTPAIA
jgi:hypothetical protein